MSREVLGPAADAGTDVLDDGRRTDPPEHRHTAAPSDLDSVTDLDAPAEDDPAPARPDPRAWLDRAPSRLRAWAPFLTVGLCGALLGALIGTGAAERADLEERRETVRVLAALSYPDGGFVSGGGNSGLLLRLVLVNAGPEPVTVTEARFDNSRTSVRLDESVEVLPGRSTAVRATVQPQCEAVSAPELKLVVTTADGETRDVAAGSVGRGVGIAPGELAQFCNPTAAREPIPVWRTTVEDDGRLAVQLRNERDDPVLLEVTSPPGTTIIGDPSLPAELPTDRSVFVRLAVQVDRCTSAAQRADAGNDVQLLINGEPDLAHPDSATVIGWFAQQIAAACPAG